MGVDLKGKIVIVRYGENFRGVKPFLASQYGACRASSSIPIRRDDGYYKGDLYPKGPWRPATGVQRGSVQYLFRYPGRPNDAGHRLAADLPESKRTPPDKATDLTRIPGDAAVLRGCDAHHAEPWWPGVATKLAGRAALHLPRGTRPGEGASVRQAGLSLHHHLGCDRHGERIGVAERLGHQRQSSRRLGVWRS